MSWYWWLLIANWAVLPLLLVYPLVMKWVWKDFVFEGFFGPFAKFRLVNDLVLEDGQECPQCRNGTLEEKKDEFVCAGECGSIFIKDHLEPWHARLWRDWGGVGLGLFMCYRNYPGKEDDAWVARTWVHEGTHCWQWVVLGVIVFFLLYVLHMLWILVTQKIKGEPYTKHPYLDCWAERMARRRAAQMVDVPPNQWPDGSHDLWAWW